VEGSAGSRRTLGLLQRHPVMRFALTLVMALSVVWAVKLIQLAASVQARASYWSQPRGDLGGLLYVALGDSAAQGVGASSASKGYVSLLAERLGASTGEPVRVINLSRSGATVADVVAEQLPRLSRLRPDVVTVAAGGNDIRAYGVDSFREHVEQLAAGLPDGALLADVPYFMHGKWQRDAAEAARIVAAAAERHDVTLVPLQKEQRARGMSAMLTDFAADWFHPNDRGHQVWADAFWRVMEPQSR
jgi:acyl-CoA thioesterase I